MTNSRAANQNSMDARAMEPEKTRERIHKQRTRRREATYEEEDNSTLTPN